MTAKAKTVYFGSIALGACLFGAAAAGYYLQYEFPSLEAERSVGSNVGFFLLINLNIIVVMILGFLVSKNIVKLVLDRRKNILGAKLRTRLVTAFVGLSLIPTVLLFMVARGMLERGLQEWFSPQIGNAVDGALAVAKHHYDAGEAQLYRHIRYISRKCAELYPYTRTENAGDFDVLDPQALSLLKTYLEEKREEYGLFELAILDRHGNKILNVSGIESSRSNVEVPGANATAVTDALSGAILVRAEASINGEFLRGYAPLGGDATAGITGPPTENGGVLSNYVLIGTIWVIPELSKALGTLVNAYDDYKELETYRRPLASSYFLTLLVVTFLIVVAAVWVGFYLAKDLSIPIGLLAEGTQQVASGNLDYRIPEVGDDELSVLVRSFNTMTEDLKETTGELVERRRYTETIIASVGVGVISLDTQSRMTTCNLTAAEMLGIRDFARPSDKHFSEVLPSELSQKVVELLGEFQISGEKLQSANISLNFSGQAKHIQLTLTQLVSAQGGILGAVLLLDDLTELVSAQRMAAWREVARRIAHEIKNPLTPIQLCAERLQRKFGTPPVRPTILEEADRQVITESTEMIVKQVENLRSLVNEFSRFARMPKSNPKPADLNRTISETVAIFRETHAGVEFVLALDPALPLFELDEEQISRAVINLIDNSIASVRLFSEQEENIRPSQRAQRFVSQVFGTSSALMRHEGEYRPSVLIETIYDDTLGIVSLNISDNGLGIPEKDKNRLFEPYFSTKRGGTGLGLAIVNTIVSDHNGFIRFKDVEPHGACFTVELPVSRDFLRKLA